MSRHCGRCRNPFIDNPDCPCTCHDTAKAKFASMLAAEAAAQHAAVRTFDSLPLLDERETA